MDKFNNDDVGTWLADINSSSIFRTFSDLYLEKYLRKGIKKSINSLLKQFGYELH
jgi:hypothetical protein